jgi:hypothetical protein
MQRGISPESGDIKKVVLTYRARGEISRVLKNCAQACGNGHIRTENFAANNTEGSFLYLKN